MKENIYLLYDADGIFCGFFEETTAENIVSQNKELRKAPISKKIHNKLIRCGSEFHVNLEMLENSETIIDSMKFITFIVNTFDDNEIKKDFIKKIKKQCGSYIVRGTDVILSTGEKKHFSFKLEDQINLNSYLTNHTRDDMIYYHADGENDTLYNYDDIKTIYKTLYNNKVYNQIYTEVLCNWINDNLTLEMLEEKQNIVSYGFCTDEMRERIGILYENQKLL